MCRRKNLSIYWESSPAYIQRRVWDFRRNDRNPTGIFLRQRLKRVAGEARDGKPRALRRITSVLSFDTAAHPPAM
ncbi:hypothetical protein ACLOJK_021014 [Asimina triloba]